MIKNHPQVCLFKPEIPQNTGNVGRLCAATQSRLHLIKPFGFSGSDKNLRRAGLDYWPYLDLEIHEQIEDLLVRFDPLEVAFFTKFATKSYIHMPKTTKLIIFWSRDKRSSKKIFMRPTPVPFTAYRCFIQMYEVLI